MQFAVPQYTDVEDRIIGSLTLKQFLIIFFAGLILVLIYTATKSVLLTIVVAFPTAIPAVIIAFVPYNGRKMYNMLPSFGRFLTAPKVYIFHKVAPLEEDPATEVAAAKVVKPTKEEPAQSRLKALHYSLEQKQKQEEELLTQLQNKKTPYGI